MAFESIAKTIARWTALTAFFLLPLTPLVVTNSLFFPFITGKGFYLRILIEIIVAAWVVLALIDTHYRPRFSWIGASAIAFVVWMFFADLFAQNVAKAFWSNFERMEGWVLLIHLLGFFFAASAILRVERKWRAWFLTNLGVSIIVSLYALLQLGGHSAIHQGSVRIDASLGNSAYLAIYFLFSVFVALWLAFSESEAWLKWSLIFLAVVETVLIFFTETRGTVIGLILGFGLMALLTAFTAGTRPRRFAIGALLVLLVAVGSFYAARNSNFVQHNHVLQRVASISPADGQVRFTLWHMAFEGVAERPIFGWGQEGFNYIFNKYYDPSLYHQEQWFDRAHNAFIDWLTAGGVPAFLFYIMLFGSAIVLLWRNSELSRSERVSLSALLVGYAVHNLFVFDNLYSYIYFFAVLALIDSQVSRPIARFERAPVLSENEATTYALPIAFVALVGLVWFVNVPGMNTAGKLIEALSPSPDIAKNITLFQDLTMHPSFAAQEIREQLVMYESAAIQSPDVSNDIKQQIASLAITEMQKQNASYPNDARGHIELSYAYRNAGDTADALTELNKAVALSPKKIEFLIQKGILEWDANDLVSAQKDFQTAYDLAPQFTELADYAAAGHYAEGDVAGGDKILKEVYKTTAVDSDVLSVAYYRGKMWARLIGLWKSRADKPDAPADTFFSLAAALYAAGDNADAVAVIQYAVTKFPDKAEAGAAAIKQIRGK